MLHRPAKLRLLVPRKWSERVIILLVMQTVNNSITVLRKRTRFGRVKLTSVQGDGEPNPTWIPVANQAAEQLAENVDGVAGGTWGDLMNIPMTAHFIGGCVDRRLDRRRASSIRITGSTGIPGLHVVDGSTLTANLGVNPSLSITAQAERAMSLWPNRGERDARPPLGAPYERVAPVAPHSPAVPATAPAALPTGPTPLGMPTVGPAA